MPRDPKVLTLFAAVLAVPQTRPAIEIVGFHMVESQAQKRSLEIESQKAKVFKSEGLMSLDVVRALVWGQGTKPFEVLGDTAVVNSKSDDLEIHNKSRVVSPDGFLFKTTDLFYKAKDRVITSEENVEANQIARRQDSDMHLTGRGLTINLVKNTYEIRRNVRTEQKTSKTRTLSISSNNLVIFPGEETAAFNHRVQVKSSDFNLKGERLVVNFEKTDENAPLTINKLILDAPAGKRREKIQADMKSMKVTAEGLTIDLDPAEGSLKRSEAIGQAEAQTEDGTRMSAERLITDTENGHSRILMQGKVSIFTGTKVGACEDATFYPDSGEIILEKVASVKSDRQVIEGERIRFSTKKSDIVVEKARGKMDRRELGM